MEADDDILNLLNPLNPQVVAAPAASAPQSQQTTLSASMNSNAGSWQNVSPLEAQQQSSRAEFDPWQGQTLPQQPTIQDDAQAPWRTWNAQRTANAQGDTASSHFGSHFGTAPGNWQRDNQYANPAAHSATQSGGNNVEYQLQQLQMMMQQLQTQFNANQGQRQQPWQQPVVQAQAVNSSYEGDPNETVGVTSEVSRHMPQLSREQFD